MTDKKPLFEILGPYEPGWTGAVCTRDKLPVRLICVDRKLQHRPIVALVGENEQNIAVYPENGRCKLQAESTDDLMRARVIADAPILVAMRHGKPVCILSADKAFPTDCDVVSFTPEALESAAWPDLTAQDDEPDPWSKLPIDMPLMVPPSWVKPGDECLLEYADGTRLIRRWDGLNWVRASLPLIEAGKAFVHGPAALLGVFGMNKCCLPPLKEGLAYDRVSFEFRDYDDGRSVMQIWDMNDLVWRVGAVKIPNYDMIKLSEMTGVCQAIAHDAPADKARGLFPPANAADGSFHMLFWPMKAKRYRAQWKDGRWLQPDDNLSASAEALADLGYVYDRPDDIPTDAPAGETRRIVPAAGTNDLSVHFLNMPGDTGGRQRARWFAHARGGMWILLDDGNKHTTPERLASEGYTYGEPAR